MELLLDMTILRNPHLVQPVSFNHLLVLDVVDHVVAHLAILILMRWEVELLLYVSRRSYYPQRVLTCRDKLVICLGYG